MNPERFDSHLPPQAHAAFFDAAKLRAEELRRAAMRDFWSNLARRARGVRAALPRPLLGARLGRPWWS